MKHLKILTSAASFGFVLLCCLDTAHAQPQLTITPSTPLALTAPSGGLSPVQNVTLTPSSATSLSLIPVNTPWLVFPNGTFYGSVPTTGVTVGVRANAAGLTTGTYTGSFNVVVSQFIVGTVNVNLTVSGTSVLSANPASLTFTALQGAQSGSPANVPIKISSSGATLGYSVQGTTSDGGNWLQLQNTTGRTTGDDGFLVSVAPSGLAAGTYSGTITAASNTTSDSVQLAVSLVVSANATLSVTPANPPPFLWQTGTPNPAAQQLTVSSTGGTVPFSVRMSPTVAWLVVTPQGGSAGATAASISLIPTPASAGLQPGTYTTSVIVTPSGGADLPGVPVKLVVSQNPLLQLSTTSLAYTARFASSQTAVDQQVTVSSSNGSAVPFTFTSDSAWLTGFASPATTAATTGSGTTPSTLTVHVNPTGLALGTYNGSITVRPNNGVDQYSEFINVTLTVTAAVQLTAAPSQLLFSYQPGQAFPPSQTVQVQSSGGPVPFTLSTSTGTTAPCNTGWLAAVANSSTTPATVTVNVLSTGIPAGTACTGTVKLDYNSGSSATSLLITVTLAVSDKSELVVSVPAGFGVETVQQGAGAITRLIPLSSTDLNTPVTFTANASSSPGAWLLVGSGSNSTPQNLVVQILPGSLAPGIYNGTILISSASLPGTQLSIPVMLTVTSNVNVTIAPSSLSFTEPQNGPLPPAQTLTLSSTGGTATFTSTIQYNNGSNWLQVTPSSGSTSGTLQVTVTTSSLTPGDYNATINFAFQGAASTQTAVNVTLHVTPPQTVTVSAQSLSFSFQVNGSTPASQKLSISGTGNPAFTIGTTSSGWLSVDTTTGNAPKDVNVLVNPQGLQPGTYNGTISITSPALANAISVPVTLTVTQAPPPQPIKIFNAASGVAGVIAPGEIITITGAQLGPATPAGGVTFKVNNSGGVDPNLAGVRVLFDNNPGTPIYVSAQQINVIVPYEINGRLSTSMVVEFQGVQSAPFQLAVAAAAPGMFTNNFSGSGQIAAINQNNTYNGVGQGFSPAPQGSVLSVYATGGGQTNPTSTTGSVTPVPTSPAGLLRIPGVVTATVGGQPATVDFAGAAPGLVTGVIQLNVHLPTGVTGNAVGITISVNGISSPLGTTIAIQ